MATTDRMGLDALDEAETERLLRLAASELPRLDYRTWDFGDSTAFEALVAAAETASETGFLEFARGYFRAWATRAEPYGQADVTAPGLAMVQTYRHTGDEHVLAAARALAEFLRTRDRLDSVLVTFDRTPIGPARGQSSPTPSESALARRRPKGVFVDCLHFDPPFFASLGATTGDEEWIDEAGAQVLGYIRMLQQPDGLFDHFALDGSTETFGHGWGRGQGWALLGMLGVLEWMDPAHPCYEPIARSARRLIAVMLEHQRPDGHWFAVVDDPTSGDETSTAAFMATAFHRAVRLGVSDGALLRPARAALAAAVGQTDDRGIMQGVSAAIGVSIHPSHYRNVPSDQVVPWGQGPFVLALAEHLEHQRRSR